jgi:DNA modification methylase
MKPLTLDERAVLDKVSACQVTRRQLEHLRPSLQHAREHSDAKITALAAAIRRFGLNEPVLIEEDGTIISGVARWLACRELGVSEVPCIVVSHLTAAEIRALRIAVGAFPQWASWDREQLRIELPEIIAELPDLSMQEIGLSVPVVDGLLAPPQKQDDPADAIPEVDENGPAVSRLGDLWQLGPHLVLCGDALDAQSYERLLGSTAARLVLTDPPYNVKVNGHVTKRVGRFDEFAMASGEMSDDEFRDFLKAVFRQIAGVSTAGAIAFIFIDWRHARLMQEAADGIFHELKNHIVWVKDAPALGSFYRSQHEFVLAFKVAEGKHVNNFSLGEHGRTRSNAWHYAGMSTFGAGRDAALALHATPKPVAMLVDAILDCSNPGDLVLDPFGGSGSTLIAAARAHRRARMIEISPAYIDTIIRRWEAFTGESAVLEQTGHTFVEVARERTLLLDGGSR